MYREAWGGSKLPLEYPCHEVLVKADHLRPYTKAKPLDKDAVRSQLSSFAVVCHLLHLNIPGACIVVMTVGDLQ